MSAFVIFSHPASMARGALAVATVLLVGLSTAAANPLADCARDDDPATSLAGCTEIIKSAWATDEQQILAFNNRANALSALGRHSEAIEDYGRALAFDQHYGNALFNRGGTHLEVGNLGAAIADFDAVIKLEPSRWAAYNNRGLARLRTGLYEAAIADFTKAIEIEPSVAFLFNNRGVAWRRIGDRSRAITDFSAAIGLQPGYVAALNSRGELHLAEGRQHWRSPISEMRWPQIPHMQQRVAICRNSTNPTWPGGSASARQSGPRFAWATG